MTRRLLKTGAVVALLFFFAIALFAAVDPIMGTWKLNLAKSNEGAAATFKSIVAKLEPLQNGLKLTEDMVSAQGTTIHSELTAKFDGMDYAVTGDPYSDTISIKRIDATHADTTWKKSGRVVATAQNVFSSNGRTWTETIATKDSQGKDITIVAVYDKQ